MTILNTISAYCPNLGACSEHNCYVGLHGFRKRIIFKGEHAVCQALGKDKKACDCIIFTDKRSLVVSVVELKSKTIDYQAVKEKFDNTVKAVELILNHYNYTTNFRIIPILLTISLNKTSSHLGREEFMSKSVVKTNLRFYDQCGGTISRSYKEEKTDSEKKVTFNRRNP